MTTSPIEIRLGLPDPLREQAARIYYSAFGRKFALILAERRAIALLQSLFDANQMITALCQNQLAGFAGMQHGRKPLFHWRLAPFVRAFGWPLGLFEFIVFNLFVRQHCKSNELLLEWICVDPTRRGQGIGRQLLEEVFCFAKTHGYRAVRLGVVDTNPGARRLYERMGFTPTETHHYPFLRRWTGFSGETIMVKKM